MAILIFDRNDELVAGDEGGVDPENRAEADLQGGYINDNGTNQRLYTSPERLEKENTDG